MTAAVAAEPVVITEPGIYTISSEDYHRDPVPGGSLSSSGARALLPPAGCPAKYRYELEHGGPEKDEFDFGHAAHREVLGDGETIVVVEHDSWRTNDAKAQKAAAYAAGKTPILRHKYDETVLPMAEQLRRHPIAGKLFAPGAGVAEQSLFWWHGAGEQRIMRRARLDWLPRVRKGRRLVVPDYKTCASAAVEDLVKANGRLGYYMQADWYLAGLEALLDLDQPPAFVFVFQEKTPPYLVTVAQPRYDTQLLARARNERAINLWRRCRATGTWPGYAEGVVELGIPAWLDIQLSMEDDDDD